MKVALWIIAICEVVRAYQNYKQLKTIYRDEGARKDLYKQFIDSFGKDNKEWVKEVLTAYEKEETK